MKWPAGFHVHGWKWRSLTPVFTLWTGIRLWSALPRAAGIQNHVPAHATMSSVQIQIGRSAASSGMAGLPEVSPTSSPFILRDDMSIQAFVRNASRGRSRHVVDEALARTSRQWPWSLQLRLSTSFHGLQLLGNVEVSFWPKRRWKNFGLQRGSAYTLQGLGMPFQNVHMGNIRLARHTISQEQNAATLGASVHSRWSQLPPHGLHPWLTKEWRIQNETFLS